MTDDLNKVFAWAAIPMTIFSIILLARGEKFSLIGFVPVFLTWYYFWNVYVKKTKDGYKLWNIKIKIKRKNENNKKKKAIS